MIRSTLRLDTIVKLVLNRDVRVIADIGSDHGHLESLLLENKPDLRIIATDISAKSLQKTYDLMKKLRKESSVETRVGDGLSVISEGEVDLAIIAGIGGVEIMGILERDSKRRICRTFVLQPAGKSLELRKFLVSHNFFIKNDVSVFEKGKYYDTMLIDYRSGKRQTLSKSELFFGRDNVKNPSPDFLERVSRMKSRLEKIEKFRSSEEEEIFSEICKNLENWEKKR